MADYNPEVEMTRTETASEAVRAAIQTFSTVSGSDMTLSTWPGTQNVCHETGSSSNSSYFYFQFSWI